MKKQPISKEKKIQKPSRKPDELLLRTTELAQEFCPMLYALFTNDWVVVQDPIFFFSFSLVLKLRCNTGSSGFLPHINKPTEVALKPIITSIVDFKPLETF